MISNINNSLSDREFCTIFSYSPRGRR
jgi:hypothetical protein